MKNLITIHTVVTFYNCQQCNSSSRPIMDVLIFISDDNQHDHHAVQAFFSKTVEFLRVSRGVSFTKVFEFTDGCSSQYTSRGPLVDISFGYRDFRVTKWTARKGVRRGISRAPVRGGQAGANTHEKLPRFLDGTSKLRHCHVRFSAPKLARLIVNN